MFIRTSSTFWSACRDPEGLIRVKTICFPKACSFNPTLSKHTIPSHINHYYIVSQLHFFEWIKWSALDIPRASKLQTSAAKARTPWASGTLRKVRDHAFRAGDVGDSELPDGLPLAVLTSLGGLRIWTKRPTIDWTKKGSTKNLIEPPNHKRNCWSKEKNGDAVKITSQGARDAPLILAWMHHWLLLQKHTAFSNTSRPKASTSTYFHLHKSPSYPNHPPYNKPIRMNCQLQRSLEQGLRVVWDSLVVGPWQVGSSTKDF